MTGIFQVLGVGLCFQVKLQRQAAALGSAEALRQKTLSRDKELVSCAIRATACRDMSVRIDEARQCPWPTSGVALGIAKHGKPAERSADDRFNERATSARHPH